MAQYFFKAEDYPIGTRLDELGWVFDPVYSNSDYANRADAEVVQAEDGTKLFAVPAGDNTLSKRCHYVFNGLPAGETVSSLAFAAKKMIDAQPTSISRSGGGIVSDDGAHYFMYEDLGSNYSNARYYAFKDGQSYGESADHANKTRTDWAGVKFTYEADTLKLLHDYFDTFDGVQTAIEGTAYSFTTPKQAGDTIVPTKPIIILAQSSGLATIPGVVAIGIGTNGDPAPVARPVPTIEVVAPTNLSVSDITETSATLNWS